MLLCKGESEQSGFSDPGSTHAAPYLILNYRNVHTRFSVRDDAAIGVPLELPRRSTILPGLFVAAMFAVFAGILVNQIAKLNLHAQGSVFALMVTLFSLFWILGWSVGVMALGALTVLLLFFGELAWWAGGLFTERYSFEQRRCQCSVAGAKCVPVHLP